MLIHFKFRFQRDRMWIYLENSRVWLQSCITKDLYTNFLDSERIKTQLEASAL